MEFFNNSGTLTQHVHYAYDVWDHLIERDLDPNGSGTYTQIVHNIWDVTAPPSVGSVDEPPSAPGNIVLQTNGQQQLTARYLNGPNTSAYDQFFSTLAEEDVTSPNSQGSVSYYLLDMEATLRDLVNASGTLIDHRSYSAFGQLTSDSNPSVAHLGGFGGGVYDPATGLVYNVHRWYDPTATVWISVDPTGFRAGDTNLARYAANTPTNATDPSGNVLIFNNSKQADSFTRELKKRGAGPFVTLQRGDAVYIIVSPCDYKAVFAYADAKYKDLFAKQYSVQGGDDLPPEIQARIEERNRFLRAAGVFGNDPNYFSGADTINTADLPFLNYMIDRFGHRNPCGSLHVDIGGEGPSHPNGINVNVATQGTGFNARTPIPNLYFRRPEFSELGAIPDASIGSIIIEGTPVDDTMAAEAVRITKPGGSISLTHPDNDYGRAMRRKMIDAAGPGCIVSTKVISGRGGDLLKTSITRPQEAQ